MPGIETLRVTVERDGAALELEAVLGRGERGAAVVAPPHPVYGGRLDNPVVVAIADGLTQAGVAPLCFNFRGTGSSDGLPSADPAQADADYAAALAQLKALRPQPYLGAGYSFGAATALRVAAADSGLARLILVAPPVSMIRPAALRAFSGPVTVVVGDAEAYAPLPELEPVLTGLSHVRLHVLPGVDHFFQGADFEQLAKLVAAAAGASSST